LEAFGEVFFDGAIVGLDDLWGSK
jgi:hypothetical protein